MIRVLFFSWRLLFLDSYQAVEKQGKQAKGKVENKYELNNCSLLFICDVGKICRARS